MIFVSDACTINNMESLVSDTTILGITLESSITILLVSFDERKMFIVHATLVFV
jgi:hypothetical protein